VLVLLAFIAPLAIAVNTLFQAAQTSPAVMSDFLERGLGPPPAWVAKIPWFGDSLAADWQTAAAGGPDALRALIQPYAGAAAAAAIAATGGVGRTAVPAAHRGPGRHSMFGDMAAGGVLRLRAGSEARLPSGQSPWDRRSRSRCVVVTVLARRCSQASVCDLWRSTRRRLTPSPSSSASRRSARCR
jgi:hypothetical protein